MTDRATIRYPYRTREDRLRWGRWTGSRAQAFTAASEALGGLSAVSMPESGQARWAYTDATTKRRWTVTTDDVIMLGAALLRLLPETEADEEVRRRLTTSAAPSWMQRTIMEMHTERRLSSSELFDQIFSWWAINAQSRKRTKDPTC